MGEPSGEQPVDEGSEGAGFLQLLVERGTPAEKAEYIADFFAALLGSNTVTYKTGAHSLKIHLPGDISTELRENVGAVIGIARALGASIDEKDVQKPDLSFLPGSQAAGKNMGVSTTPADKTIHITF